MTPTHYTIKNGITTFHYPLSFWREFIARGKGVGDAGPVLVSREGFTFTYRSFGTIEHPSTTPHKISMRHHEAIDGKMPTDEQICREVPAEERPLQSYSFHIIDLSK